MKKVLVTGGSRGIGYAIAKELADSGYKVLITGRNASTLKQAAEKIGKRTAYLQFDAGEIEKYDELIATAADMLGGLDAVVNNAGIFNEHGEWAKESLLTTTVEEWSAVMKVNASAIFFSMQSAVKYMLKHHIKGNILNITSAAGEEPVYGAYGASKITATALTRGWGKMFADVGITINGIAPGPAATEMNHWHDGDPLEYSRIPFGRFLKIEEAASLAKYLLSEEAKMICGETVIIDGGYAIR